jgi:hypothetical protein
VFLLWVVVFSPRKHDAFAFVRESTVLRIPFPHLIAISGLEEDTADSKDAPALLHFDGSLRFFRFRRLHFLSPLEHGETSNREPSGIVLQGILCTGRLWPEGLQSVGKLSAPTLHANSNRNWATIHAPQSDGYPYGAFGTGQRAPWLRDATPAPAASAEHSVNPRLLMR